jgi:phage shock protein E
MPEKSLKHLIIDTREPEEYAQSHVDGATNISVTEFMSGELPAALEGITKDHPIILYCRSGQRSNTCSMILKQHGFTNLTNGINEGHVRRLLEL